MFCLYQTQEAGRQLSPRDFQFVQTPRVAFDNARIYYEMDYRRYARQDASVDLPQRKSANNDRFNPSNKYSGISGYDPIYNATECDLNRGRIIGIDTSERWDPFHHPFYFDADSNLVYGGSRDLRDSPFEQAVRRAYEECLKRHHGKKPAPTLKKHYIGDSGQQAPPGKMLNSKAAGRLLAAGGVYNGNVAGFRKTAEQLGGDAVKGYDQVLNETTKGAAIATVSMAAGLGLGRLGSANEIETLSQMTKSDLLPIGRMKSPGLTACSLSGNKINKSDGTELISIPENARVRKLTPPEGYFGEYGYEYKWRSSGGGTSMVRIHGIDASAPAGANASQGWVVRIFDGKRSMDINGIYHPPGIFNAGSPNYSPSIINDVHIPINKPTNFPGVL